MVFSVILLRYARNVPAYRFALPHCIFLLLRCYPDALRFYSVLTGYDHFTFPVADFTVRLFALLHVVLPTTVFPLPFPDAFTFYVDPGIVTLLLLPVKRKKEKKKTARCFTLPVDTLFLMLMTTACCCYCRRRTWIIDANYHWGECVRRHAARRLRRARTLHALLPSVTWIPAGWFDHGRLQPPHVTVGVPTCADYLFIYRHPVFCGCSG